MPKLERDNYQIGYEVYGEGPPLVMLRGLARTMRHWLDYEKTIAKFCKVITLDLRGIGKNTVPLSFKHSMEDLAEDVIAVLDATRTSSAHILGVSLGGMVTLATGLKYPDRCKSLITINTSIAGQRSLRMSAQGVYSIVSGMFGDKAKLHQNLANILSSGQLSESKKQEIAEAYLKIALEDGVYPFTALKQLIIAAKFCVKPKLPVLKMPILLVYGTHDHFVPNINTKRLHSLIPHAQLVAIKDAGHEIMLDQPETMSQVIKDWINQNTNA